MPKQPKSPKVADAFGDLDLGQLAEVTGGCGGHRRPQQQQQQQQQQQDPGYPYPRPPWGYPPYGGDGGGYDVQTNVDIGQQGQSIIRR